MELRRIGRSDLMVSVLGFGTMTFGGDGFYAGMGATQVDEARRQIDICLDAGVNWFDSADIYSGGASEEILGKALGDRRKDVLIATKVFGPMSDDPDDVGLSPKRIVAACEASLKRLGTDWIDLYQVHNFDALVPVEKTLRALDDLVRSGKVRAIGCSNHAGWQLMKALSASGQHNLARYVTQQIQYSLAVRDAEIELLPAGLDQGVGALVWSPLAGGLLTGKLRGDASGSRLEAFGSPVRFDSGSVDAMLDVVLDIAAKRGCSPSQVALNWLIARPGVAAVLVGARSEAQLRDNLAAVRWALDEEEMQRLSVVSTVRIPYPQSHQRKFSPERNPDTYR